MSNITAKTSSNVFYIARCEAAKHNEQLRSREGAADIMSIDRGRLYRIESGIANPYPDEIHLMADLYNQEMNLKPSCFFRRRISLKRSYWARLRKMWRSSWKPAWKKYL